MKLNDCCCVRLLVIYYPKRIRRKKSRWTLNKTLVYFDVESKNKSKLNLMHMITNYKTRWTGNTIQYAKSTHTTGKWILKTIPCDADFFSQYEPIRQRNSLERDQIKLVHASNYLVQMHCTGQTIIYIFHHKLTNEH